MASVAACHSSTDTWESGSVELSSEPISARTINKQVREQRKSRLLSPAKFAQQRHQFVWCPFCPLFFLSYAYINAAINIRYCCAYATYAAPLFYLLPLRLQHFPALLSAVSLVRKAVKTRVDFVLVWRGEGKRANGRGRRRLEEQKPNERKRRQVSCE